MSSIVLVTGCRGFSFPYVKDALEVLGYTVWGMTEHTPEKSYEIQGDLLKPATLFHMMETVQPNYVIHLAGLSQIPSNTSEKFYAVHLQGTLNLLAAIEHSLSPIQKIILASTGYVYGGASNCINENTCPKPTNHYAMSKLAMEYMAQSHYPNLPIVIVRPFNYTGIGQSENMLIPKIVTHFKDRAAELRLGNRKVYREFNDVRFAASAYSHLLTTANAGSVINLCTGQYYCINDILILCKKITGFMPDIIEDSTFMRANEISHLFGDASQLHHLIPTLPSYTLEDTLRWMFCL